MLKTRIPPLAATVLVVAAVLGTAACELNALEAKDRRDHPAGEMTQAECLRCHSGPEWIAKIAEKEGKKPTDSLFVDDGKASTGAAARRCPDAELYRSNEETYNGK